MDNGPAGIISNDASVRPDPDESGTQVPEEPERVEAGGVPAFECDLERVLADQRHVLDAQLLLAQGFDPRKASRGARLTAALGARARPPKLLAGVSAVMTVFPRDIHHLTRAVDVDGQRKWIGVLQRSRLADVYDRQLSE